VLSTFHATGVAEEAGRGILSVHTLQPGAIRLKLRPSPDQIPAAIVGSPIALVVYR
jgi:hypothetical protein